MSDLPPYVFDHVDRRISRIVSKLLRSPRFVSWVRIYGEELQELEDSLYNLIVERFLSSAVGAQLDQWGTIVGERRDGLTDQEYRDFIRARILSNLSRGEVDRLTEILSILGRAIGPVLYFPLYPAAMYFNFQTSTPTSAPTAERILRQMEEVAPAGVEVAFIVEATPSPFGFAGDEDALGFDEGEFSRTL